MRGPDLIAGASVAGGRYRLLAPHGGARGLRFWQALDVKLDREVALTFVDAEQRAALEEQHQRRLDEEVKRAGRIFEYRRARYSRSIQQQEEWLADARQSSSERTKKILPAREGRLRRDQERLAALESEHDIQVAEIRERQVSVEGTLWAVSLVVGP